MKTAFRINGDHLTERLVTGYAYKPPGHTNDDVMRKVLAQIPIPTGFQRTRIQYRESRSGLFLDYRIIDTELKFKKA